MLTTKSNLLMNSSPVAATNTVVHKQNIIEKTSQPRGFLLFGIPSYTLISYLRLQRVKNKPVKPCVRLLYGLIILRGDVV